MKLTIFGSGYVGLAIAACFAKLGHSVVCMDIDDKKIANLQQGIMPIYEPGLQELIIAGMHAENLYFTTDVGLAVNHGEIQFIAVGTPPDLEGHADLKYVYAVAKSIAEHMSDYKLVINKSTVPVGTAQEVRKIITEGLVSRTQTVSFDVASNPEFLREGSAIKDCLAPDRIILGVDSSVAESKLRELYRPFSDEQSLSKILVMDTKSAELTKYAANAMLATKISFMNEMANLADKLGADIEQVRLGIGSDPRIGYHFINPGCGYGGSCFGKDIKALIHTAEQYNCKSDLIQAVERVNTQQKLCLFKKITQHFGENIKNKVFAVWGLAYKPDTDDMRDAPSEILLNQLWQAGARVQAYDPKAMSEAKKRFGERPDLTLSHHPEEALEGAEALVILTEWAIFKNADLSLIKSHLKAPVIFDGRNIYDSAHLQDLGITYYGIGRRLIPQSAH